MQFKYKLPLKYSFKTSAQDRPVRNSADFWPLDYYNPSEVDVGMQLHSTSLLLIFTSLLSKSKQIRQNQKNSAPLCSKFSMNLFYHDMMIKTNKNYVDIVQYQKIILNLTYTQFSKFFFVNMQNNHALCLGTKILYVINYLKHTVHIITNTQNLPMFLVRLWGWGEIACSCYVN